jgi:hypothetical protein
MLFKKFNLNTIIKHPDDKATIVRVQLELKANNPQT